MFLPILQDFSGEIVKQISEETEPTGGDSPLKMCRLTSMDEGIDDGFLDVMDAEVASLTARSPVTRDAAKPQSLASLFSAPLINKASHTTIVDDDTPVVSYTVIC